MAVIITGTPGVGKHTAGRMLAEAGCAILDINEIAMEEGLCERSGSTYDVDTDRLEEVMSGRIAGRPSGIVIGHLAPYVVRREMTDVAIVLRQSPYRLLEIYAERGYSRQKSADNAASEAIGIIAHDARHVFGDVVQIDVSEKSPGEVVARVRRAMEGDPGTDSVDWLGMITQRKDLARFFAD